MHFADGSSTCGCALWHHSREPSGLRWPTSWIINNNGRNRIQARMIPANSHRQSGQRQFTMETQMVATTRATQARILQETRQGGGRWIRAIRGSGRVQQPRTSVHTCSFVDPLQSTSSVASLSHRLAHISSETILEGAQEVKDQRNARQSRTIVVTQAPKQIYRELRALNGLV